MAQHLDLEEQEQLDQVRHFWNKYGNAITWALIVVFGAIAAWNGWQYWQRKQGLGASVLYEEIERAVIAKDAERIERSYTDLKDKFGSTAFAQQGALLAGRGLYESGKSDRAQIALEWAAAQSTDEALQAVARLRLAGLAMETGTPESAMKWLDAPFPPEFEALATDRRGDVLLAQGKKDDARAAFLKARQLMTDREQYRQLVDVKLAALGVDATSSTASPPAAAPAK